MIGNEIERGATGIRRGRFRSGQAIGQGSGPIDVRNSVQRFVVASGILEGRQTTEVEANNFGSWKR